MGPGLVDADAYGLQSREVEQQVVDQIAELPVVVTADESPECHAVCPTERMVGDKGIELAIVLGRQVFLAHDVQRHVKIADTRFEPFRTHCVAALP